MSFESGRKEEGTKEEGTKEEGTKRQDIHLLTDMIGERPALSPYPLSRCGRRRELDYRFGRRCGLRGDGTRWGGGMRTRGGKRPFLAG